MRRPELIYHKKDVSYSESPKQDRTLDIFGFSEVMDPEPYFVWFSIVVLDHHSFMEQISTTVKRKQIFHMTNLLSFVIILFSDSSKPLQRH